MKSQILSFLSGGALVAAATSTLGVTFDQYLEPVGSGVIISGLPGILDCGFNPMIDPATSGTVSFLFSAAATNQTAWLVPILSAVRIPDGGASLVLVGISLLGFWGLKRKFRR